MKKVALAALVICTLTQATNCKSYAQIASQGLSGVRQLEQAGEWQKAGEAYMSVMDSASSRIPLDLRVAAGRRAVACWTIAADQEINETHNLHNTCNIQLNECYTAMSKLEPNNAVWPYLLSMECSAEGQYKAAVQYATTAMALAKQAGPALKSKIQTQYEYVTRGNKVQVALDTRRAQMFNKIMSTTGHYGYSNSGISHSSSYSGPQGPTLEEQNRHWNEGVARQNAWENNDSGALGRMEGGRSTDQDKSRYGGGW